MLKKTHCSRFFTLHVYLLLFFFIRFDCYVSEEMQSLVPIGVVLDLNSNLGSMADLCMDMAISDFYSYHPNYTTRLKLHKKDAQNVLDVNFSVLELLKHEAVHGILGIQLSTEETFVAALGGKFHVPIISLMARSSVVSYTDNRFSLQTTPDDAVQGRALAAVCQEFNWSKVVILYENTEYGYKFLTHLNKAFQKVDIELAYVTAIPTSAEDSHLLKELEKLTSKQSRVYLVHMNPSLGYRLFNLAKMAGMMSEGHAWVITDSLSSFLNSMDFDTRDSMDGVLGIRPYVFSSKNLESFQERWKRNMLLKNTTGPIMELNIYGLWAYDTITSLAISVEKIGPVNSSLLYANTNKLGKDNTNMRTSLFGPRLLNELSITKFRGLSGDFQLVGGKLNPVAFEIINVIGTGERRVGFWTPDRGIIRELNSSGKLTRPASTKLKNVMWPGDSVTQPKGWAIPSTGNLRVGVPWKSGFKEFVNIEIDPETNNTNITGFAIDIFLAALKLLPFRTNYEFICYNDTRNSDWSYEDMLHQIPERFDMVVGDTTIWAPRASYVDFTLPYSESGVILVVKNKKSFDMWIFTKPLRWDLWLAIVVSSILMGIVLRRLEHRVTHTGEDSVRPQNRHPGMMYWSPIAILAFQDRNMVSNNWSFFILVFWLFMAFVLMQSFTANLSAILTVDQLKFAFSDDYYLGYNEGSFMKQFLTEQLHISISRLRYYNTVEEYHDAMSKGSKNGGIDAIFDEIPYMKLLLKRYDSQYKMVGPTYRTNGLGFAFPIGCPLVSYFSRAILNVTQGPEMTRIEQKNFGPGYSSQDPLSSTISQGISSLTFYDFAGLFLVIGSVTIFALICSEIEIGQRITDITGNFILFSCFMTSEAQSTEGSRGRGAAPVGVEGNSEFVQNNSTDFSPGEGIDAPESEEEIAEIRQNNEIGVAQDVGNNHREPSSECQPSDGARDDCTFLIK